MKRRWSFWEFVLRLFGLDFGIILVNFGGEGFSKEGMELNPSGKIDGVLGIIVGTFIILFLGLPLAGFGVFLLAIA